MFVKSNRAFTLIELLVVVLIIGVLSAIALPQYEMAVLRSRYAGMKDLVNKMALAQDEYYMANGTYASKYGDLGVLPLGNSDSTDEYSRYSWGFCQSSSTGQSLCKLKVSDITVQYQVTNVNSTASYNGKKYAGKKICVAEGRNTTSKADKLCWSDVGKKTVDLSSSGWRMYFYN